MIKAGFDADTAESGEEAIEKLDKNSSYDLVTTDLRMNLVSGVDVLKKVREIDVDIPVMIMSGFGVESTLFKEAMELKPCCHAIKPFSEMGFLGKIKHCLQDSIKS